jgi:hypothetical protein
MTPFFVPGGDVRKRERPLAIGKVVVAACANERLKAVNE